MIDSFLKKQGYGERRPDPLYRDSQVVYWFRRTSGTENHQYIVRMWPGFTAGGGGAAETFEVEMTYETKGRIWANTKYYGITEKDLRKHLPRLESCLRSALVYMGADPSSYQVEGDEECKPVKRKRKTIK